QLSCSENEEHFLPSFIPEIYGAGGKNVHYDLAFILDTSYSVGKENFEKIRQWVANLVESFDVAPDKTRVAVVHYSDRSTPEFTLGRYRTLEDVKRAARNMRYLGGNTMTGDAISYTTTNIFTERNGARPAESGFQKVAILLTDGRSQDYVLEPSKAAARAGIRMFAVGIGEAQKEELEEIAAEPKNAHVFHVTDFNAIDKIRGRLRRRLCESKSPIRLFLNTLLTLSAAWPLSENPQWRVNLKLNVAFIQLVPLF
uniref:VWFA domain-containing protein n=1 Tax=Xiphophorus maculatus TaxID=8083 RepID=A0A3B5Q7C8_XIPMA